MTKHKAHPVEPAAKQPSPAGHAEPVTNAPTSAAQVNAIVSSASSRITAPDRFDFGEMVAGTSRRESFMMTNQAEQSARVDARVSGDPELQLIRAPEQLVPYRDPWAANDSQSFVFEHRATRSGRFESFLDITFWWPDGTQEQKRVVLASAAHVDGGPTMEEGEKRALESVHQVRDLALRDAEHAKRQSIADEEYERESLGSHEGEKARADDLAQTVDIQLDALFEQRKNAVGVMHDKIGGFEREVPEKVYDSMDALASLALHVVTMALPNGIAHILEPTLQAIIEEPSDEISIVPFTKKGTGDETPHEKNASEHEGHAKHEHGEESLGAEGLRVGLVEYAIEAASMLSEVGIEEAKKLAEVESETKKTDKGVSADLAADFFGKQRGVLIASHKAARKENVVFRRSLGPLIRANPKKATLALNAVGDALEKQALDVEQKQKAATAREWVRVVAQAGLGVRGDTTTDMRDANEKNTRPWEHDLSWRAQGERSSLLPHDGIVDVTFRGNLADPTAPVVITKAIVRGVNQSVIEQLDHLTLGDLGLPIRASGFLGGPMDSVTVVRDESGTIDFVDNTAMSQGEARWLSKKAGNNTTARSEAEGAKILMENEIMTANPPLETDSKKG